LTSNGLSAKQRYLSINSLKVRIEDNTKSLKQWLKRLQVEAVT